VTVPPDAETDGDPADDAPPILGTWPRVYGVVLGALALYVVVFAALTAVWR
jgi:hypothetical protein